MASFNWPSGGNGTGVNTYATFAAFPPTGSDGELAVALDTRTVYEYSTADGNWLPVASPGSVLSIGTIDSQAASANGAVISSNNLVMQSASGTVPGLVNLTTQSFAGNKTFIGTIAASNFSGSSSGANTGDVTLTAVGAVPNANGASLSGQALTLQPANGTLPGVLTAGAQSIGGAKTFTGAISASNFSGSSSGTNTGDQTITLTGGVTGSGTGSFAATVITNANLTGDVTSVGNSTTYAGTLPLNKGGTGTAAASANAAFNALSPMTAGGDLIYGGASGAATRLPNGSAGQLLQSNGTTLAPSWTTAGTGTVTSVAASGPSGIATWSAAVTGSGTLTQTLSTQSAGTFLAGPTSGSAAPPTFRALQAPTIQKFTSGSGTYTTAAGALYIRVRMVGGGGGGAGSGSGSPTNGGAGGNSTFGTTLLVANGGGGGVANNGAGGTGGTASLGTGPTGTALNGADGQSGCNVGPGPGGNGGVSPFGGNGWGGFGKAGTAATTNSGSGGGGAGTSAGANPSGGGGSGGYVFALITSPSSSYGYAVGAAGTAGAANGSFGFNGAAGASGYIEVTEYYQ